MKGIRLVVSAIVAGSVLSSPIIAQQVGGIRGKVSAEVAGTSLSGITVTATSDVMPKPRSAVVREDGSYSLPLLLPGRYTLTFTNASGVLQKVDGEVLLDQTTTADVSVGASRGDAALELWDAVQTLARTPGFAELKRSMRDPLSFD
mgnify:CR=1 FL=1